MRTVVITPGAAALTFDEVQAQLREVSTAEQLWLTQIIMPAVEGLFLQATRCHLTPTVVEHRQHGWPLQGGAITLQRGPVQSVASVTYTDPAGATQTLATTSWRLRHDDEQTTSVQLLDTPEVQDGSEVVVRYTAGFATVPANARAWLLGQVAHLWANRGDEAQQADPLPHLNTLIAAWSRVPI